MATGIDSTRRASVPFHCVCGVVHPARRWWSIDRTASAAVYEFVAAEGPIEGECPACGTPARGRGIWLEVDRAAGAAILHVPADRRAEIGQGWAECRRQLEAGGAFAAFALHPAIRVDEEGARVDLRASALPSHSPRADAPPSRTSPSDRSAERIAALTRPGGRPEAGRTRATAGEAAVHAHSDESGAGQTAPASRTEVSDAAPDPDTQPRFDPSAGVPRAVDAHDGPRGRVTTPPPIPPPARDVASDGLHGGALVGRLEADGDRVCVRVAVDPASREAWSTATLRARPVLLRDRGYPLLGVRVLGSYLGQTALVDGLVDVAHPAADAAFRLLAERFELDLVLHTPGSAPDLRREVSDAALSRNAATCIESARGLLAAGEFPPGSFERAVESLLRAGLPERLQAAPHSLSDGEYRFIVASHEAWTALERLDAASARENLEILLEVEGLPLPAYEALRKRVLAASVEFGICAPRRFWRRVMASGLADGPADYVDRLVRARSAAIEAGDELSEDLSRQAWERIEAFCEHRSLPLPQEVATALGRAPAARSAEDPAGRAGARTAAAGEIRRMDPRLVEALADPDQRAQAAVEALHRRLGVEEVIAVMDGMSASELLAVVPALVALGTRVVDGLIDKLRSTNRELRQAAAIALGVLRESPALEPLLELLVRERTEAWLDVARSVASLGPSAVESLATLAQSVGGEDVRGERVARALAEAAASGHDAAVRRLALDSDPAVARCAGMAIATLREVTAERARMRGDRPPGSSRPSREFARRTYEVLAPFDIETIEDADVELL